MKYVLFSFLLICNTFLFAQKKTISENERQEDLKYLQAALYHGHSSVFRYTSKQVLDDLFDKMNQVKGDISNRDFYLQIRELLSPIGCIHTSVKNLKTKKQKKDKKPLFYLPYSSYKDGNQYWTKHALGDTISTFGWMQILTINGHRLDSVGRMEDFWPNDGYVKTFGHELINHFGNLNTYFRKKYGVDSLVNYVLLSKGDTLSVTIPAVKIKNLIGIKSKPTFWKYKHKKHFFRYDSIHDLGILKITAFGYNMIKTPMFYKKVFRFLEDHKVENLVIDLRNDGGGSMGDAHLLLSYLIDEKATYFLEKKRNGIKDYATGKSKIKLFLIALKRDVFSLNKRYRKGQSKFYENKIKKKNRLHFDGNIFVFVNGYTASAASFTASYIKEKGSGAVIGKETGGGAKGNNGLTYPEIRLPNSKLLVRIPQLWIDYNLGKDKGRGVMPNFSIEYHVNDIMRERDLEMEKLINLLEY